MTAIIILCIWNAILTIALAFIIYRHFTFEREVIKFARVLKIQADTIVPNILRGFAITFLGALILKHLITKNDDAPISQHNQ